MKIAVSSSENLADLLHARGIPLDMRCGGLGRCGRCRVKLLSGSWECAGVPVSVPATAPACRVRLTGGRGAVEISDVGKPMPERMPEFDFGMLSGSSGTAIAFDVGTTTLAAVKIRDGKIVASAGAL